MSSEHQLYTTGPIIPPYSKQPTIKTSIPNIILRPYKVEDLVALHSLRSQIEVMRNTSRGIVDPDLGYTRTWMSRFMEKDRGLEDASAQTIEDETKKASINKFTFNFVFIDTSLKDLPGAATADGALIGSGGVHSREPAECGYMLRKELWGKGIATALVTAFMDAYWNLEREVILYQAYGRNQPEVDFVDDQGRQFVAETVKGVTVGYNYASQKILQRYGFKFVSSEEVVEHGHDVTIIEYSMQRPNH